ncbi:gamma-aminobutyric acid type B receptor subunit 2-like [Amphiura filiformis]|uniref:gamma-aminobutyric acid type B receptor subunit 2-like n=1 Tax=Amphiura filiformis TaxID=82378 RepID=UPI003B213ACD
MKIQVLLVLGCILFLSVSFAFGTDVPGGIQVTTQALSFNASQLETTAVSETNSEINRQIADNITSDGKIPIYLGGFFSLSGAWVTSGIIPAVEMALDHINARADILPEYDLKMVWNDTKCTAATGTRVFFDQLFHEPQKLILIGDGCSTASQAIAGPSYHWNLNMISYGASAPTLSNRIDYPYFYRTVMPDTMFNPARIHLMKEFGWNKVGTIHGKHEIFSLTADHLIRELNEANIRILTSETFASDDPSHQIQNLKTVDAKIIAVNMYATKTRRVLCEAYKNNMVGDGYVWLLLGWYAPKWWEEQDDFVHCTLEEMRKAARSSYYISTESLQLSTSSELTIANITAAQYVEMLSDYMKAPQWSNYEWQSYNPFGYDAAWAIALVLDKAVSVLKIKGLRLEDFTYDDKEMGRIFFELLNETRFTGVSGPVSFRDGDRVGIIQIRQLQAGCVNSSWILHEEECFLFVNQFLTYSHAAEHCNNIGSAIVAIINETEYDFITETVQRSSDNTDIQKWFIGLKKIDQIYEWEDLRFSDRMWIPSGSELNGADECVFMTADSGNGWKTISCDTPLPFICRMEGEFLERPVALFTDNEEGGVFEMVGNFIWPGGHVPLDHTPKDVIKVLNVHKGISVALYAAMSTLAIIGILMALFFLAFNLRYREQRFVKMSSPNLNNLIILGSVLVYATIFVGGLDSNLVSLAVEAQLCQLRVWLLSLGFVLAFGSMFSKTWRVHKIAAFKTPKRVIIKDQQLFLMVFVLLLIDVCVLAVWHIIDPMRVDTRELYKIIDPQVPNQRLIPYYEYCSCKHQIYWLAALYSYKALLLIFGAFLAWETRQVTISALNDSKLIGISVYNVIVLCTIGVSVSFVINNDPAILYIFTSCVLIFCTTITLIIVFVPKIISVYKYPDGPPTLTTGNKTKSRDKVNSQGQIEALHDENNAIKQKLAEVEDEIKRLKESRPLSASVIDVSANDARFKRGCGLWCAGVVCGCCSGDRTDTYRPEQEGITNNAMEASSFGV